jgi:CubicO group peptidase (beta-lactamase class C family)
MTEVQGSCSARFEPLRDVLAERLGADHELGACLAVIIDGECEVDLWGGWADPERTTPWAEDTITNVWSSTKTMVALIALMLVDRGELDPYAKVARYWPEFGAAGKGDIEVRHLLSHTSGVSSWAQPVTVADLYDWDRSTALLAAQEPWWEPGTASGYHALNMGHLVGEVVRRITGLRPGEFLAREVTGPLGADFHIGLDPVHFPRSPASSPRSATAARPAGSGCSPPPPSSGSSTSSPTASTWHWASTSGSASATACRPRSRPPSCRTAGSVSGAAGAARWWSTTWTAG